MRRARRNTVVRAAGEIAGKLATLALFIVLARETDPDEVGIYVFAFAFLQVVTMPVGLGMDRLLIRRIAEDRDRAGEVARVIALKFRAGTPIVAASVGGAALLGHDARTCAAVAILGPGLLMESAARSVFGVFTAYERSELLSACIVVQRTGAAAIGLAALAAGLGMLAVCGAYSIGAAAGLTLAVILARRRLGVRAFSLRGRLPRELLRRSRPYAAGDLLGVLLAKLDVVLLSVLATTAAVGTYGAAYRLLEATAFLTSSVNGAFAAMFTYLGPDTQPPVGVAFRRAVTMLLGLLVPCAIAFAVLAEPLTVLLLGEEFREASTVLRLLSPTVVLIGLVYLGTSLVVSRGHPGTMVRITAVGVALNVALNVALIPALAERGAAIAMLGTEIVLCALVLREAVRVLGERPAAPPRRATPLPAPPRSASAAGSSRRG